MRRVGIFLLAVIALVAMAGPVSAQPKVTITGFVDNISTYTHNMSNVDNNYARSKDSEWYSRVRVRPDITAEVGTTKFVLGLEIDETFGQTGNLGAGGLCGGAATTVNGGLGAGTVCSSPQRAGATAGWMLNTDTQGIIEIKWAYTEFDIPIIPIPTRVRVGAQPWEAHYKLAVLANGDFAGIHVTNQWSPMIKTNFTYAQIEEQSTGTRDGFVRGDDFAIVTSIEVTPFKGLDIRPIFSYANFQGVTSGASRQARGGIGTGAAVYPTGNGTVVPGGGLCNPGGGAFAAGCSANSAIEDRFTVGLDARWRFGPFSLDPTVFYQFGHRDQINPSFPTAGVLTQLKRDAWFVDIRGGWQAGPLLLEAAAIYTTGNKAKERIDAGRNSLKFYEPISTDTSYFATWAEIWALGIDYFNIVHNTAGGLNPGVAIGYDKYGLMRFGVRGSYALTPAFTLRSSFNMNWTAHDVDTASTVVAGAGLVPRCAFPAAGQVTGTVAAATFVSNTAIAGNCIDRGTASFLGSELNLGFQWRFVPNVALDVVGSYMWAGPALSAHAATNVTTGVANNARNPNDVQSVVARIRYSW